MDRPDLRIVGSETPLARAERLLGEQVEQRLRDDRPDLYAGLVERPSYFAEVAADWRDIIAEVRGSPYSHGLVAVAAIVFWTAILVAPLMIGRGL